MPNVTLLYSRTLKTLFPKAENVDPQTKMLLAILVIDAFSPYPMSLALTLRAKKCRRCKNNRYFYEGKCIPAAACPLPLIAAGVGKTGRLCTIPFKCRARKALDGPLTGKKCHCGDRSCHTYVKQDMPFFLAAT